MTAGTESVYHENFTQSLNQLFFEAWKVCRNNPAQGLFLLQNYHRQKRKTAIRQEAVKQGVLKPEVLWEAGKQKDIIFPVFTNGTLLNQGSISYFRKNKNLLPGRLKILRKRIPALFISLPGEEGKYGGS